MKLYLLLLSSLLILSSNASSQVVFISGMETAGFKDWSSVYKPATDATTVTQSSAIVHSGGYSLKLTGGGTDNRGGLNESFPAITAEQSRYARFYVYVAAGALKANDSFMLLQLSGGTNLAVWTDGSGNIKAAQYWSVGGLIVPYTPITFAMGAWNYFDIAYKNGTSDGGGQLWLNGISLGSNYTLNTSATSVTNLILGNSSSGHGQVSGGSIYMDDFELASSGPVGALGGNPTAASPSFNLTPGTYSSAQSVSLSDSTSGATIYYTTNGSTPTTSSTKYTGPITVSTSKTINAIAAASGYATSAVASATYTISTVTATPSISPAGGTYASAQTVTISDATSGASIYYTTNGNTPTASSSKYTGPLTISSSETIIAIAIASGHTNSLTSSASYTIGAQNSTTISVNQSNPGPVISNQLLGMNMASWYDPATPGVVAGLQSAGITNLRWPGGSASDYYHWQSNTLCFGYGYTAPDAYFQNFNNDIVSQGNYDLSITVNYGTNPACNAGGDPNEAAAWVTEAANLGVNASHWTVGNEAFGSWEEDLHPVQHDPATYVNAVNNGYYPLMKAANPNIQIGVSADPAFPTWESIVLSQARYDFVEFHYYAQDPFYESDSYLVGQAAQDFSTQINLLKADLAAAGHPNTPIYVGELGSVYTNPGKQTTSITQALFAGQALGEMMNAGISRATWWIGYGGCSDASQGNFSSSLYGWQNYGGYMVFSDGLPTWGCLAAPKVPAGTLLPTARAYQLFSSVAQNGEYALATAVTGDTADVRAYAATNSGGAILVIFNLNQTKSEGVTINLSAQSQSSAVTVETYDKSIYDQSKNNVWAPPTSRSLGAQNLPLTLTLTPWSMNIVKLPQ